MASNSIWPCWGISATPVETRELWFMAGTWGLCVPCLCALPPLKLAPFPLVQDSVLPSGSETFQVVITGSVFLLRECARMTLAPAFALLSTGHEGDSDELLRCSSPFSTLLHAQSLSDLEKGLSPTPVTSSPSHEPLNTSTPEEVRPTQVWPRT